LENLPYAIIVGDVEMNAKTISVRARSGKQVQNITLDKFIEACEKMNKEHSLNLVEEF